MACGTLNASLTSSLNGEVGTQSLDASFPNDTNPKFEEFHYGLTVFPIELTATVSGSLLDLNYRKKYGIFYTQSYDRREVQATLTGSGDLSMCLYLQFQAQP